MLLPGIPLWACGPWLTYRASTRSPLAEVRAVASTDGGIEATEGDGDVKAATCRNDEGQQ